MELPYGLYCGVGLKSPLPRAVGLPTGYTLIKSPLLKGMVVYEF